MEKKSKEKSNEIKIEIIGKDNKEGFEQSINVTLPNEYDDSHVMFMLFMAFCSAAKERGIPKKEVKKMVNLFYSQENKGNVYVKED